MLSDPVSSTYDTSWDTLLFSALSIQFDIRFSQLIRFQFCGIKNVTIYKMMIYIFHGTDSVNKSFQGEFEHMKLLAGWIL